MNRPLFRLALLAVSLVVGGSLNCGSGTVAISSGSGGSVGNGGAVGSGGVVGSGGTTGSGGATGSGGRTGSGGAATSGGTTATGGSSQTGGTTATTGTGGAPGSGGATGQGGGSGGASATGGNTGRDAGPGGRTGMGGAGNGGITGAGGVSAAGGAAAGGSTSTGTSTAAIDCNAAMPSGGTSHSGNSQGGTGNLAWQIWSNQGSGTLTTFSTPAFSAAWNNSGDYLGRLGFEWGNSGKTYDQYGTITADFTFKKTGSGGGFSYIGIYGWSTNPCTEWYIVDDSFGTMPFNPYNSSQKGTATIDGESYKLFSNSTNGTGGSRCNASSWTQHWSVRQKARQCGTITISDHFKAWDAAGMKLGTLLEAKILVETGGGSGSVNFPVATLAKTQ